MLNGGMLLVDKPENCTSAHVVGVIKRKFGLKRVGHAGTLDPMATGLLILLCEQATKLQSFVVGEQKSYSGVIRLGIETDTDDITGQVIASNENKLVDSSKSRQEIIGELQNVFSGKINQAPPVVSAIKINGKRSYALARKGLAVPLLAREVEISLIKLGFISDSQLSYQIDCSKGTYIRSLARDIGRYLGTFGTLESIRREKIGSFKLEDAISLDELLKLDEVQPQLIQIETMVEDLPRIYLDSASCTCLKQGKQEILRDLILNPNDKFVAVFNEQNSLVCTLEQSNNEGFSGWKIARVI